MVITTMRLRNFASLLTLLVAAVPHAGAQNYDALFPGSVSRRAVNLSNWEVMVFSDGGIFDSERNWADYDGGWPRGAHYIFLNVDGGFWFGCKKNGRPVVSQVVDYTYASPWHFSNFVPGAIGDPNAPADTAFGGKGWGYVDDPNYIMYTSTDYDGRGVDQSGNNFPDWPLRLVDGRTTYVRDIHERASYLPKYVSDEDHFCIYKDTYTGVDPEYQGPTSSPDSFSVPIGIEVLQTSYTWSSSPLKNVFVVDYEIHNESGSVLEGCFMGIFLRMFIFKTSYVAMPTWLPETDSILFYSADPSRNLGYIFNRDLPEGSGQITPYFGLSMLETPKDSVGHQIGTSLWQHYMQAQRTVPPPYIRSEYTDLWRYNWMRTNGIESASSRTSGFEDLSTGSGSSTMKPGDTIHFTVALMVGNGLTDLLRLDDMVKRVHANNYLLPRPPLDPTLTALPSEGTVRLTWDTHAEQSLDVTVPDSLGKPFFGYRLYRARAREGPYFRIKEWQVGRDSLTHQYLDHGRDGVDSAISITTGLLNNVSYYYKLTAFDQGAPLLNLDPMESAGSITEVQPRGSPRVAGDVSEVRVVPNPYVVSHGAQRNVDQPVLYFNYLPEACTIRIYTVALDLVRVLRHSGGSSEPWDLKTEGGQQVGSQLFIAHIETPEGRTAVRKFAVITGQ